MQLFYAPDLIFSQGVYTFSEQESRHCVRVLRLGEGDLLHLTDGAGSLCRGVIEEASLKCCRVRLQEEFPEYEKRPYRLTLAVAPTKQMERLEWFVEKATEIGIDRIVPLLCDHSERKQLKSERLYKVATSAMKQSLKAYHPQIDELTPFRDFVSSELSGRLLIAHCDPDGQKRTLKEWVEPTQEVVVLIGPEGDFSPKEVELARSRGFEPLSLGRARLRTETAAVVSVADVAFINQ